VVKVMVTSASGVSLGGSGGGKAGGEPLEPEESLAFVDDEGRGYRVHEELGRGVLTHVRAAERVGGGPPLEVAGDDAQLGAPGLGLAIKTVLPLWVGHPLAEARIARERELSRALHDKDGSPATRCARILAAGRQPQPGGRTRPFHVTARLHGVTLAEELRQGGRRSSQIKLAWIDDALAALERIHEVGWVHRDVKPQNLFIQSDGDGGHACLIDFGLALPIGAPRGDGDEPFGTPAYVSPEVIAGARIDPRADLYSMGLVMFELFAGRRAFTSRDPIALLDAHLCEPPPKLRSVTPACSEMLERVIGATLGKDPAERPSSARELRAVLRDVPEAAGA
jgi:serine/threonine protein kinase